MSHGNSAHQQLGKINAVLYILGIHNNNREVIEAIVWWIYISWLCISGLL